MPSAHDIFLPLRILDTQLAYSFTERCDELITLCEKWEEKYSRIAEEYDAALAKGLVVSKDSDVATKFEPLSNQRVVLLKRTDELALEISETCGYQWSIRLAEVVRGILEKEQEETLKFLTMWIEPKGWVAVRR